MHKIDYHGIIQRRILVCDQLDDFLGHQPSKERRCSRQAPKSTARSIPMSACEWADIDHSHLTDGLGYWLGKLFPVTQYILDNLFHLVLFFTNV